MSRDRVWHFYSVETLPATVDLSHSIGIVASASLAEAEAPLGLETVSEIPGRSHGDSAITTTSGLLLVGHRRCPWGLGERSGQTQQRQCYPYHAGRKRHGSSPGRSMT